MLLMQMWLFIPLCLHIIKKNQGGPLNSDPSSRINLLQCSLAVGYNSRQRVLWKRKKPLFIRIRVWAHSDALSIYIYIYIYIYLYISSNVFLVLPFQFTTNVNYFSGLREIIPACTYVWFSSKKLSLLSGSEPVGKIVARAVH